MNTRGLLGQVDRLLPARVAESELFRARFVAFVGLTASGTAVWTAIGISLGNHVGGLVAFAYAAATAVALGAFKLGALAPRTFFWFLEVSTCVLYLGSRMTEAEVDWPLVTWLSVLPLLAVLCDGWRAGLVGLLLAGLTALGFVAIDHFELDTLTPVSTTVSAVRGSSLVIALFAIAVVFDALRRDALERLERSMQARGLFLANMSHELRTPMNGVIGLTDLLLNSEVGPETRASLELIKRSGNQMVSLINDILDLTRLESGRLAVERLTTEVASVANDVVTLARPLAQQKGLTLTLEVDARVPRYVLTDPTRLRQVLTNLLGNAIKFTERGGVTVSLSATDDALEFRVRDTGIGIDEGLRARLFRPFEQGDASYTRRFGGSGLGLTITRQVLKLLGGGLEVVSGAGGSTFIARVPLVSAEAPSMTPSPEPTGQPPSVKRVLVVEDNEVNLRVALAMLERLGCSCVVARDGEEALVALERETFDAVFMDCHMPKKDGFAATQELRRRQGADRHTWVVAVTASALAEEVSQCFLAGMDDVLTKPITLLSVRGALERVRPSA